MTDKIDKIFKENLDGYGSVVSPNIWEGLAVQMAKQNRRKWLLLLLIIVVLSSLFLGLLLTTQGWKNGTNDLPPEKGFALINDIESELSETDITVGLAEKQDQIFSDVKVNSSSVEITPVSISPYSNNKKLIDFSNISNTISQKAINASLGSNTYSPPPHAQVKFGKNSPFRCVMLPQTLTDHNLYLETKPDRKFRSKKLGDCFEGPPTRYMIGLNASIDYPFRSIRGISTGELGDYIDQRNDTESGFLSFNAGIQAGYFHPSGFLMRSGLQYTQINEKFLLVKENVIKIQTHITIDTMINSDGTYTIHRDTSIVEGLGRKELKTTNHFRMLDIPLIAGYTFDWRKMSIEINGGIIFNLLSKSGGRIFNTDLIPSYYGSKGPSFTPFKTYYGVSLYGSISLLSNFYGRTQLFLEPNARFYIKSFSSPDYPIRQKYFVVGLSTGARYYF